MVTRDCYSRQVTGFVRRVFGWVGCVKRRECANGGLGARPGRPGYMGQGVFVFAATVVCCVALAARVGAERVDSGWAFSGDRPFTLDGPGADPQHQIFWQHVLQQIDAPLLESTAAGRQGSGAGRVRFAVRPDGVDGWRPAVTGRSPAHEEAESLRATSQPESEGVTAGESPVLPEADGDAEPPNGEESEWTSAGPVESGQPLEDSSEASAGEHADAPSGELEAAPRAFPDETDEAAAGTAEAGAGVEPEPRGGPALGPIVERSTVAPVTEPTPPPPLTKQLIALRSRVRGVLKGYYRRQLNSREHDPWEVMHGMLAYGVHSRIRQGGPRGAPVTSVGWLCYNKPCKDLALLYVTPKGELRAKYGVGLQGHLGQLLAMLAQCRVSEEYPIRVGKREFTIKDLIEAEQKTCYPKSELTFKLLAFQYYLDLNDQWVNDQGVEWDFPRLIREELAQPIRGAACGGTHRLSSLSLTVKARQRRGEPLDGEYARAAEFVKKHHRYAFSLQNRDGSLSTEWFRGRGDDSDINRRIKTTGHILEWLCYSLSDEELRQPKTIAAVSYLANLMYKEYDNEWEVGPMSHATHALLIYDERVFQPFDNANYSAIYRPKSRSSAATAGRADGRTIR